jgi:ElaB/YqjD/DUF883 family membrane-anchored ribosome-binding protein
MNKQEKDTGVIYVYPNGTALTQEGFNQFYKTVKEVVSKVASALSELFEAFRTRILDALKAVRSVESETKSQGLKNKRKHATWLKTTVKHQVLDRRPRQVMIRNNC